jgi:hypothetical protein
VPHRRVCVQGYLAHKKQHPPRTLLKSMPRVLGGSDRGRRFLMSEVPLYTMNGVRIPLVASSLARSYLQGYLVHKKSPTPPGPT